MTRGPRRRPAIDVELVEGVLPSCTLAVLELAWSLEASDALLAYIGNAIERAGGFRPLLMR